MARRRFGIGIGIGGGLRRGALALTAACLAALGGGCRNNLDPASFVTGLRTLMLKADPPEVPPGQTSTVSILNVDTLGRPISTSWYECTLPPQQGQGVNPGCLMGFDGGTDQPLGTGAQVMVMMPTMVSIQTLGLPDGTGGLYLPVVAQVSAGSDSLLATYRLRVNLGEPPNHNPMLTSVSTVMTPPGGPADAGSANEVVTPIDPATPIPIHSGDVLTLRVDFAAGSAETYTIPDTSGTGMGPRTVVETLSVSYFATAGTFSTGTTGVDRQDELLTMDDAHLSAGGSGTPIDLWIVGRDERGGADYLHRTLMFQ